MFLGMFKLQQVISSSSGKESQSRPSTVPHLSSEIPVARVERTVSQTEFGRVSFQGVSWRAKCVQNLTYSPGTRVQVLYQQDTVLWVDTLPKDRLTAV